jgi:hypothetical protein
MLVELTSLMRAGLGVIFFQLPAVAAQIDRRFDAQGAQDLSNSNLRRLPPTMR